MTAERELLDECSGGLRAWRAERVNGKLQVEGHTSCGWYAESFPIPIYDADPAGPT